VNPPWSKTERKPIRLWTEKCLYEYRVGNAKEILLVVPGRFDSKWYVPLKEYSAIHLHKRVTFELEGKPLNNAPFSTAIIYLGNRLEELHKSFESKGTLMVPYNVMKKLTT